MTPQVQAFFDPATCSYSYVVSDPASGRCAIVDPVLDYCAASGRTSHAGAGRIVDYIHEQGLVVDWLLETHVHADHLSAAAWLKRALGGQLAIGGLITQVQQRFGDLFNAGLDFATDGRQFDLLLQDGDRLSIGNLELRALHTPGHTPACMTYVLEIEGQSIAFVGDTLFMPDYGTARCDFPGASARTLYRSIQRILALPAETRLFMCHDYLPGGRELRYMTTVAEQRASNIHIHEGISEDSFVAMREARDATLEMPVLILPSVQINMRSGQLPEPEENGVRYLKIPLNVL
ncbi:putative metallo-hydrolase [compost metagenome]